MRVQHECPGWTAEWNVPQRVCSGRGVCNETEAASSAQCTCDPDSQRYGNACQFAYGAGPDQIKQDACAACAGEHESCLDGECRCDDKFYRVFGLVRISSSSSSSSCSAHVT